MLAFCFHVTLFCIKYGKLITTPKSTDRIGIFLFINLYRVFIEAGHVAFTYLSHTACLCSPVDRRTCPV